MIDDHDIERLAAALNQLRPDWPTTSLRTFIAKNLATRAKRDVAVALTWVACEPNTASPARVLENGPWWKAAGVTGELTARHPTPSTACRTCGGNTNTCHARGCDNPNTRPLPRDPDHTYTEAATAARNLLHAHERPTP